MEETPEQAPLPLLAYEGQELRRILADRGYPPFRGSQVQHWLRRSGVLQWDEMHNLPQDLITEARASLPLGTIPPRTVEQSADGTRKYLFPTRNGGLVETALIPEEHRVTLCISTQVGCRRSCTFCQTARQGFQGNLEADEIINQYHSVPERREITNIVYMGMGEPLDNLSATVGSIAVFTEREGYRLPPRRITVSTVGIHPALEQFLSTEFEAGAPSLAISLHNPFPEERRQIMPVENGNPIEETVRLLRSNRQDTQRRISFEYTLFAGYNDTRRHVDGIARLLNGLRVRINLIPFHTIPGVQLTPAGMEQLEWFRDQLWRKDIPAFIRRSRGQDINAACGLLWTRNKNATPDERH